MGTLDSKSKKFKNTPVKNAVDAVLFADKSSKSGLDAYLAIAEYKTTDNRTKDNVEGACCLIADIDVGLTKSANEKGYATLVEGQAAIKKFRTEASLPKPNYVVNSGTGLHVYWMLDEIVDRDTWITYAEKFKTIAKKLGFLADPSRTADCASVLRVPGTMNYKYDPPQPVTLLFQSTDLISKAGMFQAIDAAFDKLSAVETVAAASVATHEQYSNPVVPAVAMVEAPDLDKLASALKCLTPDCDEFTWKFYRLAALARIAREHPALAAAAYALAKSWSSGELGGIPSKKWLAMGSDGLTGAQAFEVQWKRFLQPNPSGKQTSVGTIYFHAKEMGWVCPSATQNGVTQTTADSQAATKNPNQTSVAIVQPQPTKKAQAAVNLVRDQLALEVIQTQFGLINLNGKLCVFDRNSLAVTTQKGNVQRLILSTRIDGALLIVRALRAQSPDVASEGVIEEFFVSPQTICYSGVDFHPTVAAPNYLNLWVGPTVAAKAGSWELIRSFLLEVICNGVQANYMYLISYIAHALQFPEDKPGVMIILLGGQGIGKGTLSKILRLIWSATFLQVSNIDEVVGNFNAALERAYIVFLDEALFSGNRRASDALKSLVTEPVVHINEKHQPSRQTSSFHRIFAASNAEHLKNTERDDRRDFSLRVSESRKDDHAYWKQVNHEIENGGVEAMVHDLLAMDLTEFNVRAKPHTTELLEQKLLSLGPIQRWWYECLHNGGMEEDDSWPDFVPTVDMVAAVCNLNGGKMHRKPSTVDVVAALKKLCPSVVANQKDNGLGRKRGLDLPPLEQARAEFYAYIGSPVAW